MRTIIENDKEYTLDDEGNIVQASVVTAADYSKSVEIIRRVKEGVDFWDAAQTVGGDKEVAEAAGRAIKWADNDFDKAIALLTDPSNYDDVVRQGPAKEEKKSSTAQEEGLVRDDPFKLHDRVEYEDKLGRVVSIIPNVYGTAIGVRFDDGDMNEFTSEQLKRSNVEEEVRYDTPVDEVMSRWAALETSQAFTEDQILEKLENVRAIRIRAKALASDSKMPLSARVVLDQIITSASAEVSDLNENLELLRQSEGYADSLPKFELPDEIGNGRAILGSRGDASWLADLGDEAEVEIEEFDWDSHLSSLATDAVESVPREKLENEAFVEQMTEYVQLTVPEERREAVAGLIRTASEMKLSRPEPSLKREASAEKDFDLDNLSDLYL